MSKKNLVAGTLVLTAASLITRLLGFGFRIYQSQVMGSEGMGLYQLLFPIYMLLWAASSAGIALSIAKLVATELSKGQEGNAVYILKVSLSISIPFSLLLSVLVFIFSPVIAKYYIHAPVTELSLRILALCVPFMSTACCLRGYFQGYQEMSITALAQIVEQIARMTSIYLLAYLLVPLGIKYICALGVIGMCMGEVFSFIMSFIAYKIKRSKIHFNKMTLELKPTLSNLINLCVPITANRFLTSGLTSFENILIPMTLQYYGLNSHQALSIYGEFSGMALPLLFFPSMVTSSLATALVPAISEAVTLKRKVLLKNTITRAIQFAFLIGIGGTTLFLCFPYEIALTCYKIRHVGTLLKYLALICPFLYLQNILIGTMNGLGMQKETFKTNIIASLLCIATILFLVPKKGIIGFILAMLIQSGFICCMLLTHITKEVELTIDVLNWFIRPCIAGLLCAFIALSFHHYLFIHLFPPIISTILSVSTLGFTYILCLILIGSFSIKDIRGFLHL